MTRTLEAVYENGVFRPVSAPPVDLADGEHVQLTVESGPQSVLQLASKVYQGLSDAEIDEVERIAFDRRPLFPGSEQ